jgi:FMN-dependent NADH-azoreductase
MNITNQGVFMNVLQLNSSVRGADSISTQFADKIAQKLKNAGNTLTVRDLSANPVTTLDSEVLGALFSGKHEHEIVQQYTQLINELLEQDVLILGVPMYNFSIPTQLKNYFDAVARAGVTFKYGENGAVGLTKIQKAYVVLSRGGLYKNAGLHFQEQYIETFLKFIGVKEIELIYVEGIATGEEGARQGLQKAQESVEALVI